LHTTRIECLYFMNEDIRNRLLSVFDADFYLAMYPDIKAKGIHPLDHYMKCGWMEGRDPRPDFSTSYYLELHPDVANSGMNPFYHWVQSGAPDSNCNFFSAKQRILTENAHQKHSMPSKDSWAQYNGLPAEQLTEKISNKVDRSTKRIILAFGHDNYTITVGGIQILTAIDQEKVEQIGGIFIQLHPIVYSPYILTPELSETYMVGVIINGENVGISRAKNVLNSLMTVKADSETIEFGLIVHSPIGHSVDFINECSTTLSTDNFFWVHDFYSLCPCYNLLRNNIIYCHAPDMLSQACSACFYGRERFRHCKLMNQLFQHCNFTVIAPSIVAMDIWLKSSKLPYKDHIVRPYLSLKATGERKEKAKNRKLRVAFLGLPRFHKGWDSYSNLVRNINNDPRYDFFLLGQEKRLYPPTNWKGVTVCHETPNAMLDALKAEDIDIAMIWSVWPETFCIAAFEAIAAGCVLVTNVDSGNVAYATEDLNRGIVLENDDEALVDLFSSGEIYQRTIELQLYGLNICDIHYSDLTADLMSR
jgi:hypothetical protein